MNGKVTIRHRESDSDAEADIFDNVTLDDFQESQATWRPVLWGACAIMKLTGQPLPLYKHWDWTTKAPALTRLDVSFFGLKCEGRLQGLMKADTGTLYRCRTESQTGQELVYVDYVETAPWNLQTYMEALGRKRLYSGVGVRLMQAAVELSIDNELKGRVGLHSLPDSEAFYHKIGMTPHERDKNKQCLMWFEFTPENAQSFLENYK